MANSLASRLVAVVILCVLAWLASAFLPSPIGTIAAILCGVGVLIIEIYIVFDLVR